MQIIFRQPKLKDLRAIHRIAKEFYQGFEVSKEILADWIKNLPKQFIVVEVDGEIAGCIFWEYLEEIKAIPYFHKTGEYNSPKGKYAYVSEIVIGKKYKNKGLMWLLYGAMKLNLKKDCRGIVWLTGEPKRMFHHEETEHTILKIGGLKFVRQAKNWEYAPGKYTDSHNIYFKPLF